MKPSGGGVNDALTAEDQEAAKNGENFIIPDNAPAVRYIRFRTNNTWGNYTLHASSRTNILRCKA